MVGWAYILDFLFSFDWVYCVHVFLWRALVSFFWIPYGDMTWEHGIVVFDDTRFAIRWSE